MPTVFMAIARVRDWKAVQRLSEEDLLDYMWRAGATRCHLHRNLEDASQLLLIIEAPYRDDLDRVIAQFHALFKQDVIESSVWEVVVATGTGEEQARMG